MIVAEQVVNIIEFRWNFSSKRVRSLVELIMAQYLRSQFMNFRLLPMTCVGILILAASGGLFAQEQLELPFPPITAPKESVLAEDSLEGILDLEQIFVGGNGCLSTPDRATAKFIQNENAIEITPLTFSVLATSQRPFGRKNCTLVVPFSLGTLATNERLVITQVDLLGKVDLESQASAHYRFEAFVAGQTNEVASKTVVASDAGGVAARVILRQSPVFKTKCGEASLLRLNASLNVKASSGLGQIAVQGQSEASVKSIKIYLKRELCTP